MKYTRIFLFAMFCCSLSFCASIQDGQPSIKQGVFGRVLWQQGNFMPSPDRPQQKESIPTMRIVYIYKLTKISEAEGEAPLFSKINTNLVAKVKTNKEGYFQCKLTAGKYSIFTLEEGGKLFGNLFDGNGSITPFEVKKGELTTLNININYKAFY
jgi:hypothetical protein